MKKFAAIFDWDGVIIDSGEIHKRSWEILAEREKLPLREDHFEKGFGRRNEYIIPILLQWADPNDTAEVNRLANLKEAIYREIFSMAPVDPLPGALDLLEGLKREKIPCAVGSSTHRANIELAIKTLRLGEFFSGIISGEDVEHGKPAPDVFLKAAESVGCKAGEGVVFEDAFAGIEAGLRGGFKVVAVATTNPVEKLNGTGATCVVHRLTEVTPQMLREFFA